MQDGSGPVCYIGHPMTTKKHAAKHHAKHSGTAHAANKGKRTARAPKARMISQDIRTLIGEVKDLRTLRAKYDQLVAEHHGLLGALRDLSNELASGARTAWNDYRKAGAPIGGALGARQRVRAPSSAVDDMTTKLMDALPSAWSTKEQICKSAGLDPKAANSAFRRLVLGYKRGGKNVPAALESNGKRGTEGRYRKR